MSTKSFNVYLVLLCGIALLSFTAHATTPVGASYPQSTTETQQATDTLPLHLTVALAPGVAIELVYIPGGTFTMGATPEQGTLSKDESKEELPVHEVTLSGYYMATTECTQEQWDVIMLHNPSSLQGKRLPVTDVTIYDCDEFVVDLSNKTGYHFALPTEAQWEYAARGAHLARSTKYSGSHNIAQVAWYAANSSQPHTVATKLPNELGLYDMSGNVHEICSDQYSPYQSTACVDPQQSGSGQQIFRGGAYNSSPTLCRTSARAFAPCDYTGDFIGFRLVILPASPDKNTRQQP